jgi:hypothetical protein
MVPAFDPTYSGRGYWEDWLDWAKGKTPISANKLDIVVHISQVCGRLG